MRIRASSLLSQIFLFFFEASLVLFSATIATAYSVTLSCDPNEEPYLEGYKLYYSEESPCPPYFSVGKYPERILADPLHPMFEIIDLDKDLTYYFVLTAYDKFGNESDYSNIVSVLNGKGETIICSSMRLINPNGGEIIPSGSLYTIDWDAPVQAEKVKLQYSLNNGKDWKTIQKGIVEKTYNWQVPLFKKNKNRCLVRITAYSASNRKIGVDKSDAQFKVEKSDAQNKMEVVTITSPNGGEILNTGNVVSIDWNTHQNIKTVARVELKYSLKGGKKWKKIETITGDNPGTYIWILPTFHKAKDRCMVKVLLKDGKGKTLGKDTSDTYFRIEP